MFISQNSRMPAPEKANLVSNGPKMINMVDQVSQFLADSLQIVDTHVDQTAPLVEVSRQEIRHLPTKQRVDEMDQLADTYKFVAQAEDLSERMYEASRRLVGKNINLGLYTHEEPYYYDDQVIKEGAITTTVDVGGIGEKIMHDVAALCMGWLDELDSVLSEAASIRRTDAATKLLHDVKQRLCIAIAERVAMMSKEDVLDDRLSSRALGAMIDEEVKRSRSHGEATARADVRALKMLATIAKEPSGEEARKHLESGLPMLNYVTRTPPHELVAHSTELKLDQLARALVPDLDIEVRVALATFWSDNYGQGALFASNAAIEMIDNWKPNGLSFSSIVRDGKSLGDIAIPQPPFLHMERRAVVKGVASKRSGLDEKGERAVRIVRCIWELASKGAFARGVAAAEVVAPVATDGVLLGRMAANMIISTRDVNNKGFKLSTFLSHLYDMEGCHVEELDKAACALSMFSCAELEEVFHSNGEILPVVCESLTRRTRNKMIYQVNHEYSSFATDALAFTLPIIERRRNRLGLPRFLRSSPIADVLSTIPRAAAWTPLCGTLRLDVDSLRGSHRSVRELLDCLHEKKILVKRTGSSKKKIWYEFDTVLLNRIMAHRALGIRA